MPAERLCVCTQLHAAPKLHIGKPCGIATHLERGARAECCDAEPPHTKHVCVAQNVRVKIAARALELHNVCGVLVAGFQRNFNRVVADGQRAGERDNLGPRLLCLFLLLSLLLLLLIVQWLRWACEHDW
jgi:hypothetical protein